MRPRRRREPRQRTRQRTWVQAVVLLWSDFPEGRIDDGCCIFVHGPRLYALLHDGRPNRLNPHDTELIATAIAHIAESDPAENPVPSELEHGPAQTVSGQ